MHIDRIPKFLLTVKENPWRNTVVEQRFRENSLDVETFYGVAGQTVGVMPLRTVWDNPDGPNHSYKINPGKTSITISKLLLFQHIIDLGCEEAIIFENDVTFCPNFKEEFEESYNALPEDWEAVHVGSCCTEGKRQRIINDRVTHIVLPLCCHALMFKRSALIKAVQVLKSESWGTPSDTILAKKLYPFLNHYCFIPTLVDQDGSDSEAGKMEVWQDCQGWFDFDRVYDEQLDGAGDHICKMVEVGTWKGRSAVYMASEIKRRLKNVTLYCVDTWQGNSDEPAMKPIIEESVQRYGSLYNEFIRNINRCGVSDVIVPMQMTSVEAAKQFREQELMFCFIDAGHDYDSVLSDCRAWYPKVAVGRTLAGHDANRKSVRDAVEGFCREVGKVPRYYRQHEGGESCWLIDNCNA
jgi:GR25 family glycosyltransferase involved in LPS biosynthesis